MDAVQPRVDVPPPPLRWPPPPPGEGPPPAAARTQLRALTALELRNTVTELLGEDLLPGELARLDDHRSFPDSGYRGWARIDDATLPGLFEDMSQIARRAASRLSTLLPARCRPLPAAADEAACAGEFIGAFGRRAFRRPVDRDEAAALRALYDARRAAGADFAEAARVLVTGMLLSPHFLYHGDVVEPPPPGSRSARLDSFSLAARLSYGLWARPPDALLEEHATLGLLRDLVPLKDQARRLLADDRALPVVQDFVRQWLMIDDLALAARDAGPPGLPPFSQLTPAMLAETDRLVADVFQTRGLGGGLETLFLTTTTTIDPILAPLYGLAPLRAPGPETVSLDPRQRAGILTHASFLARHAHDLESNPVLRGTVIVRRLLCVEVPDEPPNVDVPPPPVPPAPDATTRERFEIHGAAICASCHNLIDPAGFAFEHYDGFGRFRSHEKGKPIDASGTVVTGRTSLRFNDAPSLARELVRNQELAECVTKQWFRYLLRRKEETVDGPSLLQALFALQRSQLDLHEMMATLILTPAFTHRALAPGEGAP